MTSDRPDDPGAAYRRCLRCGRPISGRESMGRGYGPACWRHVRADVPDDSGRGGIVLAECDLTPGLILDYTAHHPGVIRGRRTTGQAYLWMLEDGTFEIRVQWHAIDILISVLARSRDIDRILRRGNRMFGTNDRYEGATS